MEATHGVALFGLWYVVFLFSLTCHEAAHALVSLLGGDRTAYHSGQVSLNPLPHVRREPIGTVLVPLLTFFQMGYMMGWASAPYDPSWSARHPRRAAVMAAAGPGANLLLAIVSFVVLRVGLEQGTWEYAPQGMFRVDRLVVPVGDAAGWVDGVSRMMSIGLVLNVALFLFNLIPLPPMDGASVLAGFVEPIRRLHDAMASSPFGSFGGLLVAWLVFPTVFRPVFGWVLARLFG